jgi:hypothetical protein
MSNSLIVANVPAMTIRSRTIPNPPISLVLIVNLIADLLSVNFDSGPPVFQVSILLGLKGFRCSEVGPVVLARLSRTRWIGKSGLFSDHAEQMQDLWGNSVASLYMAWSSWPILKMEALSAFQHSLIACSI